MPVDFVRREISEMRPIYRVIDDCVKQKVKEKGELYLPKPDPTNLEPDNDVRYATYLTRAIFYDVTTRTLNGLVGQAFANDLEILTPDALKPVVKDANGKNVTLEQAAKEALEYVLSKGRCGLLIDYPKTDQPATQDDINSGRIKPAITIYAPENVINWDVKKVGSQYLLSLVVLVEIVQIREDDGFTLKDQTQYRVLRLDDNLVYTQTLYTPKPEVKGAKAGNPAKDKGTFATLNAPDGQFSSEDFDVIDSQAKPLNEIPFTFIGCVNNDPGVDPAPLYNLAQLNIGHYRNSADYEESCYQTGQPTYVVSGISADWFTKILKGKIKVGSRVGIPLPKDAKMEILQPNPNIMPKEAMEHKEKQMVAIGAKLVENDKVEQTATAANIENTSETSILATACKNVSAAYLYALQKCAVMLGAAYTDETLKFEINTDFAINRMSAEERAQTIADWVGGAITFTEMRALFRESGLATLDDEAAKKELDEAQAKKDAQAATAAGQIAEQVNKFPKPAAAAA